MENTGTDNVEGLTVRLGSTVRLRNVETGAEERIKLVPYVDPRIRFGTANGHRDRVCRDDLDDVLFNGCTEITDRSPLGRALLSHPWRVGNVVEVEAPGGTFHWEILEIQPLQPSSRG